MPSRSFSLHWSMLTGVLTAGIAAGPWVAFAQTTVIEDFEGYNVTAVVLDPTTVPGSGWTRDGVLASDWDVICCSGDFANLSETFDGSPQFLALRRSSGNPPTFSDENTDFAIPTIVKGFVSLELNPRSAGGQVFRMALHDSGSGSNAVEIIYTESGFPVKSSGFFRVLDATGATLAESTGPFQVDGRFSWDRWFKILVTLHGNGTFDLNIFDIGPTSIQCGDCINDPARGNVLTLTGVNLPVPSIDTFCLPPGTTNRDGVQPTVIDNIIASDFLGRPIDVAELKTGAELSFSTQTGKVYQAQFSDPPSGPWTGFGALVSGDGATKSVVTSTTGAPANREYRVVEF